MQFCTFKTKNKMKKTVMLAILATGFLSCKKGHDSVQSTPPTTHPRMTIVKEVARPDQTIQVPLVRVVHSATVDVGSVDGAVILGGKFSFTPFGSFVASRDVKNFFYRIKDGAAVIDSSKKFATVSDGINSFSQAAKQLERTKVYTLEFIYDVASTATDGAGIDDGGSLDVAFYYSQKASPYDTLGPITLQKNTFVVQPASSIETTVNTGTPVTQNAVGGQEVEVLRYDLRSIGGNNTVTEQGFRFDNVLTPTIIQAKVYGGSSLVGSATISGQTAVVSINAVIPENAVTTYSLRLPVGAVSSDFSRTNIKATLDYVKYTSASGEVKTNQMDRAGNDIFVFKSIPTVAHQPLSGVIIDSTEADGYKVAISAPSSGAVALKTISFPIIFADNGTNDTLRLLPKLMVNGTGVNAQGVWTRQNGDTTSVIGEGDTQMTFTFTTGIGEVTIPAGSSITITLRLFRLGFKHPFDGDGFSVGFAVDQTSIDPTYKFLNKGSSGWNAKLFSSSVQSGGAVVANFVWSDKSTISHSALFGLSSNDWSSGYMLPMLPVQIWNQ
jgi:hypothetical protein